MQQPPPLCFEVTKCEVSLPICLQESKGRHKQTVESRTTQTRSVFRGHRCQMNAQLYFSAFHHRHPSRSLSFMARSLIDNTVIYVSMSHGPQPLLFYGLGLSSLLLFYFIFSSTSLSSLIVNLNFFLSLLPASPPPRLSLSHLHHPPPSSSSSLLVFVSYIILSFVPFSPFKFITHHVFYSHLSSFQTLLLVSFPRFSL